MKKSKTFFKENTEIGDDYDYVFYTGTVNTQPSEDNIVKKNLNYKNKYKKTMKKKNNISLKIKKINSNDDEVNETVNTLPSIPVEETKKETESEESSAEDSPVVRHTPEIEKNSKSSDEAEDEENDEEKEKEEKASEEDREEKEEEKIESPPEEKEESKSGEKKESIDESRSYDYTENDLLFNLKIISDLGKHDKISCDDKLIKIDDPGYLQGIRRWSNSNSRTKTLCKLTEIIDTTFEYIDSIYTSETEGRDPSVLQVLTSDNSHVLQKFYQHLLDSMKGLSKLKETYKYDRSTVVAIRLLLDRIKVKTDNISKVLRISV